MYVLGFYTKRNLTRQIEFKFSQVVVIAGHKRAYVKTLIDYVQQESYICFCNAGFTYLLFVCISEGLAACLSTCSQAVAFQGTV